MGYLVGEHSRQFVVTETSHEPIADVDAGPKEPGAEGDGGSSREHGDSGNSELLLERRQARRCRLPDGREGPVHSPSGPGEPGRNQGKPSRRHTGRVEGQRRGTSLRSPAEADKAAVAGGRERLDQASTAEDSKQQQRDRSPFHG